MISTGADTRIQPWLVSFGILFAAFHILPPFIDYEIHNRLEAADLFDVLTPFVVIFLSYRLYIVLREESSGPILSSARFLLFLGAVSFVEGHGMHLSANAVARHLVNQQGTPVYRLNYFFDEIAGHLLWDAGTVLLTVGFVVLSTTAARRYMTARQSFALVFSAGGFGFAYFANAVEGQTTPLTLPAAVLLFVWIAATSLRQRRRLFSNPVLCFFFFGFGVALLLFCVWIAWKGGLPQFSEVGIL